MPDSPPHPGTGHDTSLGPDGGSTARRRRWIRRLVIIALLVVLLVVVLALTGVFGGEHRPGPPPGGH
jgi:hypothetical protein